MASFKAASVFGDFIEAGQNTWAGDGTKCAKTDRRGERNGIKSGTKEREQGEECSDAVR